MSCVFLNLISIYCFTIYIVPHCMGRNVWKSVFWFSDQLSRDMRFPTMWYVRPAMPQISLRIPIVWSEPAQVTCATYLQFYAHKICLSGSMKLTKIILSRKQITKALREGSGSVVECLTRDRGAGGSSLTYVTALCPWARHINPSLISTGSTQEDPSLYNWKIVDGM